METFEDGNIISWYMECKFTWSINGILLPDYNVTPIKYVHDKWEKYSIS